MRLSSRAPPTSSPSLAQNHTYMPSVSAAPTTQKPSSQTPSTAKPITEKPSPLPSTTHMPVSATPSTNHPSAPSTGFSSVLPSPVPHDSSAPSFAPTIKAVTPAPTLIPTENPSASLDTLSNDDTKNNGVALGLMVLTSAIVVILICCALVIYKKSKDQVKAKEDEQYVDTEAGTALTTAPPEPRDVIVKNPAAVHPIIDMPAQPHAKNAVSSLYFTQKTAKKATPLQKEIRRNHPGFSFFISQNADHNKLRIQNDLQYTKLKFEDPDVDLDLTGPRYSA